MHVVEEKIKCTFFLDIYWGRNLACFLNVNEQRTQEEPGHFFTEWNTFHAYTNCSDSILKNRVKAEFLLLMLAFLQERNNQKTDLHCMSISTSKSRKKSLVTSSSCTMTIIFWILTELVIVFLVQVEGEKKVGASVSLFARKPIIFAALICAFYNSFCPPKLETIHQIWQSANFNRK